MPKAVKLYVGRFKSLDEKQSTHNFSSWFNIIFGSRSEKLLHYDVCMMAISIAAHNWVVNSPTGRNVWIGESGELYAITLQDLVRSNSAQDTWITFRPFLEEQGIYDFRIWREQELYDNTLGFDPQTNLVLNDKIRRDLSEQPENGSDG